MTKPNDWLNTPREMLVDEVRVILIGDHLREYRWYQLKRLYPKTFRTRTVYDKSGEISGFKIKRLE